MKCFFFNFSVLFGQIMTSFSAMIQLSPPSGVYIASRLGQESLYLNLEIHERAEEPHPSRTCLNTNLAISDSPTDAIDSTPT